MGIGFQLFGTIASIVGSNLLTASIGSEGSLGHGYVAPTASVVDLNRVIGSFREQLVSSLELGAKQTLVGFNNQEDLASLKKDIEERNERNSKLNRDSFNVLGDAVRQVGLSVLGAAPLALALVPGLGWAGWLAPLTATAASGYGALEALKTRAAAQIKREAASGNSLTAFSGPFEKYAPYLEKLNANSDLGDTALNTRVANAELPEIEEVTPVLGIKMESAKVGLKTTGDVLRNSNWGFLAGFFDMAANLIPEQNLK